jgi:ribosome-binding protein aMBF1 (putative translation factor)
MIETTTSCSRCSRPIEGAPIGVSVEGGPLHELDPALHICLECARSLAQWLDRGRNRNAHPKPQLQESPKPEGQHQHRKHRSRGDRARQKQRKALLRNVGLVALLVAVNVMVMFMLIKFLHSPSE